MLIPFTELNNGQNCVHTHTCTRMCARAHTYVYFFPIGIHEPQKFKSQRNIIYYLKNIIFLPKIAHLQGRKLLPAYLLAFPDGNSKFSSKKRVRFSLTTFVNTETQKLGGPGLYLPHMVDLHDGVSCITPKAVFTYHFKEDQKREDKNID